MYDCVVIGAGVVGCATARALSRYAGRFLVVEATADVANGASKANSAIVHAGFDCAVGSAMARMNVEGNRLYDEICEQLDVPLIRCGSLVLAFDDEGRTHLEKLLRQGEANGVPGLEIWEAERVRREEPGVSEAVVAALHAPTAGITCPYELTYACAENAAANAVEFRMDWPVTAVAAEGEGFTLTGPGGASVRARTLINAAGVYADEIARLAGDASFRITPRRGEYLMFDKGLGKLASHVLFQTPGPMGKGVLVSPTVDGNLFIGPSASDQESREDTGTTAEGLDAIREAAARSVPELPYRDVIRSFAGLRAVADSYDFIIGESRGVPGLFHAAGICSPGLSSAPAIAETLSEAVAKRLSLGWRQGYQPYRKHIRRFAVMTQAEREEAMRRDPRYARVICRCETVTEAEIVEAIHRTPGARSVDAVKRRTRAGMGRCQGGFCMPRVMEILSRELGTDLTAVTQFGGGSWLVREKTQGEEGTGHANG